MQYAVQGFATSSAMHVVVVVVVALIRLDDSLVLTKRCSKHLNHVQQAREREQPSHLLLGKSTNLPQDNEREN